MRRPKDMTREELEALPDGPMRYDEVVIESEEQAKELKMSHLRLGDTIRIPRMEVGIASVKPDDIAFCAILELRTVLRRDLV